MCSRFKFFFTIFSAGIYSTLISKRMDKMGFIVSGIVALIMLAYLTYAMFNPEKF